MLKNYLKIAFRNIMRRKAYALINIFGLSIGIASCLFLWVIFSYELSYDNYHENKERIYRVNDNIKISPTDNHPTALIPPMWAEKFVEEFPEVEKAVRFTNGSGILTLGDEVVEEWIVYADADVFDVFTYEMLHGNPQTALAEPYSLVITEEIAQKYFPDNPNPVGENLFFHGEQDYTVTGVLKNLPHNSSYRFRILASFSTLDEDNYTYYGSWLYHVVQTYILLADGANPSAIEARFPDFIKTHIDAEREGRYRPFLEPFKGIHVSQGPITLRSDPLNRFPITYLYIFASVGLLILLIACVNFINLATAKSTTRAREVGIRKVAGAQKQQLVFQFLMESILIATFSSILAMAITEVSLIKFNTVVNNSMEYTYWMKTSYWIFLLGITSVVGVLSGLYPAFVLSHFRIVKVLKGALNEGSKASWLRKGLVVLQFTIAIVLIISNVIFFNQINFLRNKDKGFSSEKLVRFPRPPYNDFTQLETIRDELLKNPEIEKVSFASHAPGMGYMYGRFIPEGSNQTDGSMLRQISIDYDFLETSNIQLAYGRNFSRLFPSDTLGVAIVNETAVREFGWEPDEAIGKTLDWINSSRGRITLNVVGVVKDFHQEDMSQAIAPLIMHFNPHQVFNCIMRINSGNTERLISQLNDQWKEYQPDRPIHYNFLDDVFEHRLRDLNTIVVMLMAFTILAILIACLGLFALSSFSVERRTKEIGIRKVMGASVAQIAILLSKEFTKWVIWANILAYPIAYIVMKKWLSDFAYRVNINLWSFALSGVISIGIALLTVSYKTFKAAASNPINSLKYE